MSRLQRLRTVLTTRDLPCDVWLVMAAVALAGLGWVMVSSASVSYTHLTLPTICSV